MLAIGQTFKGLNPLGLSDPMLEGGAEVGGELAAKRMCVDGADDAGKDVHHVVGAEN